MDDDRDRMTRRRALALLGSVGLGAVVAACSDGDGTRDAGGPNSSTSSTGSTGAADTVDCVLTPELMEGPFYLDVDAVRSDITDGKPGTPLMLAITVADASGCAAVPGAAVDVWHADAEGVYSGVGNVAASDPRSLRGTQITDARGRCEFRTIYPGWYPGRAVHIHVKVHAAGETIHTGQLFFPKGVTSAVYRRAPYASRGPVDTPNDADGIYRSAGANVAVVRVARNGVSHRGEVIVGVRL
jgi:protocatechuate 3,4-dioxygenase beta subunit